MSAGFSQYGAVTAAWQVHSTGRQLQRNLPAWIDSLHANDWRGTGEAINSTHEAEIYATTVASHGQVDTVLGNVVMDELMRLLELVKGSAAEAQAYMDDLNVWLVETGKLVDEINARHNVQEQGFPEPPVLLSQPEIDALAAQLEVIQAAGM